MQELQNKINVLQIEKSQLEAKIDELRSDNNTLKDQNQRTVKNNLELRSRNNDLKEERDKYKSMFEWFINQVSYSRGCPPVCRHYKLPDCDSDECQISCRECWIEAARKAATKRE